ncbi:TauD/TfdA family dioxygenase [Streptomyces antimicrobicus]|uniref:TauD/TfdA family dioxygenase n=1 Tax=Streptomyces antimicrobicus TaxID=2883108 RepID=A0ABS8B316_9ACTN|nr:TauD/TfdA family dioxygenase [Streptomyces antimicrobicus]MCB5179008.1 TauD/TfdA family dioxygenase [Streptomyces antimicrobicus]
MTGREPTTAPHLLWPPTADGGAPRAVTFDAGGGSGRMLRTVAELTGGAAELVRDVTIGMPGDGDVHLVAEEGEFWFHTDAAFLASPPRWMVIAVLEAEGGGALDLLPVEHIDPAPLSVRASYLTPEGVQVSPVLEHVDGAAGGGPRMRYRRDRMLAVDDADALAAAHEAVERAADRALPAGELRPGQCLLVDNWTVLHRRRPFRGRRVIRRLWFDAAR